MKTSRQQDLCQNDLLPTIKLLLLQTNVKKLCCFVCELKKYLLGFTLLGFLSRGTDTCHVGNYFLGVLSLTGTRLATVG